MGFNLGGCTVKTVRNKTNRPIRVPLPGGKVLHLGPAKEAQIADNAAEHASLLKLVKAGSIEVLGEGERTEGMSSAPGSTPEQTHGRNRSTQLRHRGDR